MGGDRNISFGRRSGMIGENLHDRATGRDAKYNGRYFLGGTGRYESTAFSNRLHIVRNGITVAC